MASRATTTPVTRRETPPASFATSQYVLTAIAGGIFTTISFDLEGGMKAGQQGMAFTMARTALRNAVRIYLKANGRVVVDPPDDEIYDLLREADAGLAEQAWRLECENPLTEEDLRSYIATVVSFTRTTLASRSGLPSTATSARTASGAACSRHRARSQCCWSTSASRA